MFEWCINGYYCYTTDHIIISNSELNDIGYKTNSTLNSSLWFDITLKITTWYGSVSNVTFEVIKTNTIEPFVTIDGPSTFNLKDSNNLHQNGQITLYPSFRISSNFSCLDIVNKTKNNSMHSFDSHFYQLQWSVTELTNSVDLWKINTYLSIINDGDDNTGDLVINMKDYLIPGHNYTFYVLFTYDLSSILNIKDVNSKNASHTVFYQQSDIICQIAGGNKHISNQSLMNFENYWIYLDGYTFTYDPDLIDDINMDKSHLEYSWDCIQIATFEIINTTDFNTSTTLTTYALTRDWNCSHGLHNYQTDNQHNSSNKHAQMVKLSIMADLKQSGIINYNLADSTTMITDISYQFSLMVKDRYNPGRPSCNAIQTLIISDIKYDSDHDLYSNDSMSLLSVSLTALKSVISQKERLRLISSVDDYYYYYYYGDHYKREEILYYEYHELNKRLTDEEIENNRINNNNQNDNNLVLEGNTLESGVYYLFSVYVHNEDYSKYGQASVEIYVSQDPSIIEGSFTIKPDCRNSSIIVTSIDQLLDLAFDISINTNTEYLSLLYQFSYLPFSDMNESTNYDADTATLIHPTPTQNSYLDDIRLPSGSWILQATVFDVVAGTSVSVTSDFVCEIIVSDVNNGSDDQCNDDGLQSLFDDVLNGVFDEVSELEQLVSTNEQYTKYFGYINVIVGYLTHIDYNYNSNTSNCVYNRLTDVLDLFYNHFGSNVVNLCQTDYVTVCIYFPCVLVVFPFVIAINFVCTKMGLGLRILTLFN